MSLVAGTVEEQTGLAYVLFTEITGEFGEPASAAAAESTTKLCNALAKGMVNYFKANAQIVIKPTDVGLQQYGVVPADTAGPTEKKYLSEVLL